MNTKPPPHNELIEQIILGTYLAFEDTQEMLNNTLKEEDFHSPRHRSLIYNIYKYISLTTINNDSPVEMVTFIDFLSRSPNGTLASCGGSDYIASLAVESSSRVGLDQHLSVLKELSIRRQLIGQCSSIINSCYDNHTTEIGDIVGDMRIVLEYGSNPNRNLAQSVKDLIEHSNGIITSTYVYNCLQVSTRKEKKNVSAIMGRLEKDGFLEKTYKTAGEYRIVDRTALFEDWQTSEEKLFRMRLPFGMERYVEILPGDVIVYAGTSNSGKSCLAFETIKLNMREHSVVYFSSEISSRAFRKRLELSDEVKINDWKVKFSADLRADNASDIIQPNAINILDYLEVTDGEYYRIPGIMAQIHHKIGDGVAVICLQKNKGADFAVGGEQTRSKASLYCTLDEDRPGCKLTIGKCKNFTTDVNPNGFEINYKIVNGIKILPEGFLSPAM